MKTKITIFLSLLVVSCFAQNTITMHQITAINSVSGQVCKDIDLDSNGVGHAGFDRPNGDVVIGQMKDNKWFYTKTFPVQDVPGFAPMNLSLKKIEKNYALLDGRATSGGITLFESYLKRYTTQNWNDYTTLINSGGPEGFSGMLSMSVVADTSIWFVNAFHQIIYYNLNQRVVKANMPSDVDFQDICMTDNQNGFAVGVHHTFFNGNAIDYGIAYRCENGFWSMYNEFNISAGVSTSAKHVINYNGKYFVSIDNIGLWCFESNILNYYIQVNDPSIANLGVAGDISAIGFNDISFTFNNKIYRFGVTDTGGSQYGSTLNGDFIAEQIYSNPNSNENLNAVDAVVNGNRTYFAAGGYAEEFIENKQIVGVITGCANTNYEYAINEIDEDATYTWHIEGNDNTAKLVNPITGYATFNDVIAENVIIQLDFTNTSATLYCYIASPNGNDTLEMPLYLHPVLGYPTAADVTNIVNQSYFFETGQSFNLSVPPFAGAANHAWGTTPSQVVSSNSQSTSITIEPLANTTVYNYVLTNDGCMQPYASINFSNTLPNIIGEDTLCVNANYAYTLDNLDPNYHYNWSFTHNFNPAQSFNSPLTYYAAMSDNVTGSNISCTLGNCNGFTYFRLQPRNLAQSDTVYCHVTNSNGDTLFVAKKYVYILPSILNWGNSSIIETASVCNNQSTQFSINSIPNAVSYSFNFLIDTANDIATNNTYVNLFINTTNPIQPQYAVWAIDANGCSNFVKKVDFSFKQPTSSNISATICSGTNYTFGSQILNTAGIYTRHINNIAGCDSIITLHLTVNNCSNVNQGSFPPAQCGYISNVPSGNILCNVVVGASGYLVKFYTINTNTVYAQKTISTNSVTFKGVTPALQDGTQYDVTVTPIMPSGPAGIESAKCRMGLIAAQTPNTVTTCSLTVPTCVSNPSLAPVITNAATIKCSAVTQASTFQFRFENVANSADVVLAYQSGARTRTLAPLNLTPGATYGVSVRATVAGVQAATFGPVCYIQMAASASKESVNNATNSLQSLSMKIDVTPNPIIEGGTLFITSNENEKVNVVITGITGKVIFTEELVTNTNIVLSTLRLTLKDGIYFITATLQSGERKTIKIIKY